MKIELDTLQVDFKELNEGIIKSKKELEVIWHPMQA